MRYVISTGLGNSIGPDQSYTAWAAEREAEGWQGLAVGDHVLGPGLLAHAFAVLGAMAAVTNRVELMTAMTNNLVRSPVETAQAAITLDNLSGGRFALGFGAGWVRAEIEALGLEYPQSREAPADTWRQFESCVTCSGPVALWATATTIASMSSSVGRHSLRRH